MEKPGQRVAYPEIIDRPEIKTLLRKYCEAALTLVMWGIWIVWIWPFIEAMVRITGSPWPLLSGYGGVMQAQVDEALLIVLRSIALVIGGYIAWVAYSCVMTLRRKNERRKRPRMCARRELVKHLGVDAHRFRKSRKNSNMNVFFADHKLVLQLPVKADASAA